MWKRGRGGVLIAFGKMFSWWSINTSFLVFFKIISELWETEADVLKSCAFWNRASKNIFVSLPVITWLCVTCYLNSLLTQFPQQITWHSLLAHYSLQRAFLLKNVCRQMWKTNREQERESFSVIFSIVLFQLFSMVLHTLLRINVLMNNMLHLHIYCSLWWISH